MSKKDYYQILGISRHASQDQIRAAYRALAREFHPDLNPHDLAAEPRFKEIVEAYTVLADPNQRGRYDERSEKWRFSNSGVRGAPPGSHRISHRDLTMGRTYSRPYGRFEGLFADVLDLLEGSGRTDPVRVKPATLRPPVRGEDIVQVVEVSMEDLYSVTNCVLQVTDDSDLDYQLSVDIPVGVCEGYRVKVPNEGQPGKHGGPPGDLYVEVRILPHPTVRREGADLRMRHMISISKAILGGSVSLMMPDGAVVIDVPAETPDGTVIKIGGRGLPTSGNVDSRGDLFVELHYQIPQPLTNEMKSLLRQMADLEGH